MKRILVTLIALIFTFSARADEGMWIPSLIGSRIPDMQQKGFKLTAEDLYSINQASLKDGIVRFGRGCTGELVSSQGLLFTNHHCSYSQIQSHSTVEHVYLTNGFWAMSLAEELPNPGLTVTFLVRMEDVTERVLAGTEGLDEESAKKKIKQNSDAVKEEATEGTGYTAAVEPFFYGNQYFLFVSEIYRDVRLVGAPPSSIGKFGGDTDNWMWPRHTGDFSIFRVYADKDNNPADYSPDNVPYRPKRHFDISTEGVKPGDFTMVYGFPGTTQQFLTSEAVDYVLNHSNPVKIGLHTMRLDIIKEASEADPAVRIAYAAKAASISNSWKKWQGESLGLERLGTIAKKRAYEQEYSAWAVSNPEYSGVLDRMSGLYAELLPVAVARDYYNEAIRTIELFTAAGNVKSHKISDGAESDIPEAVRTFYKDYYPSIDRAIAKKLINEYMENLGGDFIPAEFAAAVADKGGVDGYVDWLFDTSALTSLETAAPLFTSLEALADALENDPALQLHAWFTAMNSEAIAPSYRDLTAEIISLYNNYVRGMRLFEPQRDFFPDANSTLRIAYGHVKGYSPADGVYCLPVSTLDGIIEKDDPQIYDYNIPQRLRDIYAARDYGRWEVDGTVPVCFLATNHTTGGNSGSPVLNANGELIGINFDRTWLSTMSDIEFDPEMCRNVAIDIRYLLFVVDKIGGASYLFDEMTIK